MTNYERWVGVDLDGTLAHFDRWRGYDHIGKPIPAMVKRIKAYLAKGVKVKIFTSRAADGPHAIPPIEAWSQEVFGQVLEVTCIKSQGLIVLYDDRARQVVQNTGKVVTVINKMKDK